MAKKKKVVGKGLPRKFVYETFEWDDPGAEFSDEDVLGQVAVFLPALAGGKISRKDMGEYVEVTFAAKPKKLG